VEVSGLEPKNPQVNSRAKRALSVPALPARLLLFFIALPLLAYLAVGVYRYHETRAESELRVDRALRIAQEHALKILESNEVILDRMKEAVGGNTPLLLRNREKKLHDQFLGWSENRAQTQSIWVWDMEGRPVASDRLYPVSSTKIHVFDRPYFKWHYENHGGLYLSERAIGRTFGTPYFEMSIGRYKPDGSFNGVLSTSMSPVYFEGFYKELIDLEPGMSITMVREDGAILARWPVLPQEVMRLTNEGPIMTRIHSGAKSGTTRGMSFLDGRNRFFAFGKVGQYPIYISAGMADDKIVEAWLAEMSWLAALVFPPMLGLYFAAHMVLRRTQEALGNAEKLKQETASRKQIEDVLLQAQKLEALGRLTGGAAHDFNNALMVISTNLYLLKRKNPTVDYKQFDAIGRAVDTATKLTRQLLAFSRRQPLVPKSLKLQTWLPGVEDLIKPVLGSKVELRVRIDEHANSVFVDKAELELALINLSINAKDAMPDGGQLTIFARSAGMDLPAPYTGEMTVIEVSDTGTGIAPEILDKVFEPFFTTKPLGEGTGLGLSQIYGMCQRTGGVATVESCVGVGTTVRLFFPAVEEKPGTPAEQPQPSLRNLKKNILLVEDNEDVAAALVPVLEEMGCKLTCFDRAEAAMDWLASQSRLPDLLLSDVVMPGEIDGLGLAMHVQVKYPGLKILLMSGYAEQLDAITGLGFEILPKPCAPELLAETIERVFAQPGLVVAKAG
jgi:signal transduction histidine kinase